MVRCAACAACVHDARMTNCHLSTIVGLVERADRHVCGERPKARDRRRYLLKAVLCELPIAERIPPVVKVAKDERRQVCRLTKKVMCQEVAHLPVTFAFGESEMPVDQMQVSFGRSHDDHLGAARLFEFSPDGDLMVRLKLPAGENQVAVAARLQV